MLNNISPPNLYQMTILPALFARVLYAQGSAIREKYMNCLLLAVSTICDKLSNHSDKEVASNSLCDASLVNDFIVDIVVSCKGCLTVPSIYLVTDNGLACIWFILASLQDCSLLFKHPDELLAMFNDRNETMSFDKSMQSIDSIKWNDDGKSATICVKYPNPQTFTYSLRGEGF